MESGEGWVELDMEELTADDALLYAIQSIDEATKYLKGIKPKENAVALMELLDQTLRLLEYSLEIREYERIDLDFENDEVTLN